MRTVLDVKHLSSHTSQLNLEIHSIHLTVKLFMFSNFVSLHTHMNM